MHRVFVILSLILFVGCSSERAQQQNTIDWSKGKDIAIHGKVIVQIDATNRTSLVDKVKGESRLDEKEKQLIIDEFKSIDYTCYRVKKIHSDGKTFLFTYGDCFSNPNGGFGNSTVYECQDGEWKSVGGCHYD
jgi:hypothetical protein